MVRTREVIIEHIFVAFPDGLLVTLLSFSGRPNVWWNVPDNHQLMADIKSNLTDARDRRATYTLSMIPPRLGYKGLVIGFGELAVGPGSRKLQLVLLDSIPDDLLPAAYIIRMKREVDEVEPYNAFGGGGDGGDGGGGGGGVGGGGGGGGIDGGGGGAVKIGGKVDKGPVVRKKRRVPAYNPFIWNLFPFVFLNNCYNYANNRMTHTFAQPGRGAGNIYAGVTGALMEAAAVRDGLRVIANPQLPDKSHDFVVALVVDPSKYKSNRCFCKCFFFFTKGP